VLTLPDAHGRLDATAIVEALRSLGFDRVVCEGGPALAAQLVDADLVDELCLATSPRLGGGDLRLLGNRGADGKPLELRQLIVDDAGGLYARWLLPGR
jgi:riboflavin biosynthesis pyrimidine reductase